MYRLLIVDNEDYVVEGLIGLFGQLSHLNLEIIGAYSTQEALNWLSRTKIDIVISDIRMPGMDGMALQQEIIRYWPKCKLIFLSGFNDFDYIQRAIRHGAIDYVLKTDGDEALVQAVEKAIHGLSEEIKIDQLLIKSKQQLQAAVLTLQKDFIRQLLQGESCPISIMAKQFEELQIPLSPTIPVFMVVGRIDEWAEGTDYYDRLLLTYAILNIAGDYLDTSVIHLPLAHDFSRIVWLIQPKELNPHSLASIQDNAWGMINLFVQGTFELIQSACKEHLKLTLSVITSDASIPWDRLAQHYSILKSQLVWGLGPGQELLIVNRNGTEQDGVVALYVQDATIQLYDLIRNLENNQQEQFKKTLDELMSEEDGSQNYYMVASLIVSFYTQWQLYGNDGFQLDIEKLLQPNIQGSWNAAVDYIREIADKMFEHKYRVFGEQEDEIIGKVKRFIAENLSSGLSLTIIAEMVGHNSSYLSRLFKQKSGVGIAEFIADARLQYAKNRLVDPRLKIQKIVIDAGFASVQYFYRVFKKATGITPQEYRDRHTQKSSM